MKNTLRDEAREAIEHAERAQVAAGPFQVAPLRALLDEADRLKAKLTAVGKALDPHYSGGDVEVLAKRVVENYDELEDKLYPGSV